MNANDGRVEWSSNADEAVLSIAAFCLANRGKEGKIEAYFDEQILGWVPNVPS